MVNYRNLRSRMSMKMHFINSHLDYLITSQITVEIFSDEQGEHFHQDFSLMEERYQGRITMNMLVEYCWCLMRDEPNAIHKRK